jgi:hypothetical protein
MEDAMPEKATKPTDYAKKAYTPQTGSTVKTPPQPQKQGGQSGNQGQKK